MTKKLLIALSLAGFLAGEAVAADLPMKAPEPIAPVLTWNGFYLGAVGGWARATASQDGLTFVGGPSTGDFSQNGWIFGGTVGYNWQPGMLVVGVEVDISAASIDGSTTTMPACTVAIPCTQKIDWLHTGRLRLGVPFGQVMPYITGGAAVAGIKSVTFFSENSQPNAIWGPVVGGGLEWLFLPHWSAKAEYLYIPKFYTRFVDDLGGTPQEHDINLFRLGVNYHLGYDGPVTARY